MDSGLDSHEYVPLLSTVGCNQMHTKFHKYFQMHLMRVASKLVIRTTRMHFACDTNIVATLHYYENHTISVVHNDAELQTSERLVGMRKRR